MKLDTTLQRKNSEHAFCFFALSSFEGKKIFDVGFEMQRTSNDLHHSVFPFESRLAIISRHNIYKKNNATLWWSCKLICTSAPAYHILSIDIPAHKNMQIFYAYAINYSSSANLQTFSNIVPLWYARLMCRQNKNKQIFYANGMQVVSAGTDRQAALVLVLPQITKQAFSLLQSIYASKINVYCVY